MTRVLGKLAHTLKWELVPFSREFDLTKGRGQRLPGRSGGAGRENPWGLGGISGCLMVRL